MAAIRNTTTIGQMEILINWTINLIEVTHVKIGLMHDRTVNMHATIELIHGTIGYDYKKISCGQCKMDCVTGSLTVFSLLYLPSLLLWKVYYVPHSH